jgi:deazaflavin-dependent oxidoreductase (nitroreductase family)
VGYLDLADRTWPLLSRLMGVHTLAYRASGGLIGRRIPGLRAPVLLLDHVGARSGTKRTSPLLYLADGDDLVIVASKGGYPKNPAWYHNLVAHPDTAAQVGRERRDVHARMATAAERERLWPRLVDLYPPYADYQARSKGREIPIVVLEPR